MLSSRRIEGELISNSVAIVDMLARDNSSHSTGESVAAVKRSNFYWNSDSHGSPVAIFDAASLFAGIISDRRQTSAQYLLSERPLRHGTGNSKKDSQNKKHRRVSIGDEEVGEKNDEVLGGGIGRFKFWPYSGITVFSPPTATGVLNDGSVNSGSARVIVVGQLVEALEWGEDEAGAGDMMQKAAGSLSFREALSVGVQVGRPYDPPDMWRDSSSVLRLPSDINGQGSLRWISVVAASGRPFATVQDSLYLLGSYDTESDSSLVHANSSSLTSAFSLFADKSLFDIFAVSRRHRTQVLGRVRAGALLAGDMSSFELLVSADTETESSFVSLSQIKDLSQMTPKAILPGVVSEASMHFDRNSGRWVVISLQVTDSHIRVCRSKSNNLGAAWECVAVAGISPPWNDKHRFITYAARAHPELDPVTGGVGVLSFATNLLTGPNDLFKPENFQTYCPLFVKYHLP